MQRERYPHLRSTRFWLTAILLGAALYLLRTQTEHMWPAVPLWVQSLAAFVLCGLLGERLVSGYWPRMRSTAQESYEIVVSFLQVGLVLTAVLQGVFYFASYAASPEPVAWTSYMAMVLLDGSYRW